MLFTLICGLLPRASRPGRRKEEKQAGRQCWVPKKKKNFLHHKCVFLVKSLHISISYCLCLCLARNWRLDDSSMFLEMKLFRPLMFIFLIVEAYHVLKGRLLLNSSM